MRLRFLTLAATVAIISTALSTSAQAPLTTLPLWPHATPEPAQTTDHATDSQSTARITSVTVPTLAVYPPHDHNTGSAAIVFPGGGYQILAWDKEGLDPCRWLNSLGMTCLLVKYRIPQPKGEAGHYPADPSDLEDAQQAMRLARAHAAEWHIDPTHIGVMGFSAGGNLAVLLSTHPDDHHVESTPAAPDVDTHIDARADFAIVVYPAYLAAPPTETELFPAYTPNHFTPPTFLIQAENDRTYGKNALVYFRALMDANIPAELHYFAGGGHGFGMNPVGAPEEHWPRLAANWLRTLNMIPPLPHPRPEGPSIGGAYPCPLPDPAPPTHRTNSSSNTSVATTTDPSCW
jgi:acetyl esterase/lipase